MKDDGERRLERDQRCMAIVPTMIIRTECKVDNVTVSYTVAYSPIDHVQVGKYAHELYIAIIYLFNHSS